MRNLISLPSTRRDIYLSAAKAILAKPDEGTFFGAVADAMSELGVFGIPNAGLPELMLITESRLRIYWPPMCELSASHRALVLCFAAAMCEVRP